MRLKKDCTWCMSKTLIRDARRYHYMPIGMETRCSACYERYMEEYEEEVMELMTALTKLKVNV